MRDEEAFIVIAIMAGISFMVVSGIVCRSIVRMVSHWRDVSLKLQLVERGFTPDQIEQVVLAGRWEQGPRRTGDQQPRSNGIFCRSAERSPDTQPEIASKPAAQVNAGTAFGGF
jgi:hypothetical protein